MGAIDWIAPRLDDWHESVRRAAVIAVAKIAEKGDQHAISLESSSCDDRSWIVRKAATDSLAKTANSMPSPLFGNYRRCLRTSIHYHGWLPSTALRSCVE